MMRVSLGRFDLSCEAPLLMLDVNAALDGNIDRFFGPYDHDVNLVRFFESFQCAPEATSTGQVAESDSP